ncbi:MAG TPA: lipase family protein [Jatrophihabitantaceae bacterium]
MRTFRGAWTLIGVVVIAFATALVASPPPAAAAIPAPADDPFYRPPPGFADRPNGTILRSRPIVATALSVPLAVHAWQVLVKSIDAHRRPTAEVATVMVPITPWLGPGPRPLVSYQTAEDGVGDQCAPSYALRTGLLDAGSNAELETPLMSLLLLRGWAVVTTDYEGPSAQFLAGPQEGYAVLDGIRAALRFGPDGLGASTPTALWGYSGGAFATAWATQLRGSHAPELSPAGIAVGGLPADLDATMRNVDGGYGFGLVVGGLIGIDRAYPEADLDAIYNDRGRTALAASADACTVELVASHLFGSLTAYTISPSPYDLPALHDVLAANSPSPAATNAPVYSYHAEADELVPVAVENAFVAGSCAAGDQVQIVRPPGGSHNTELLTGAPGAIGFLADRFAGRPPVDDCS